jgi:hypothetical protein
MGYTVQEKVVIVTWKKAGMTQKNLFHFRKVHDMGI